MCVHDQTAWILIHFLHQIDSNTFFFFFKAWSSIISVVFWHLVAAFSLINRWTPSVWGSWVEFRHRLQLQTAATKTLRLAPPNHTDSPFPRWLRPNSQEQRRNQSSSSIYNIAASKHPLPPRLLQAEGVMLVELIARLPNVSLHIILFYLLIACA